MVHHTWLYVTSLGLNRMGLTIIMFVGNVKRTKALLFIVSGIVHLFSLLWHQTNILEQQYHYHQGCVYWETGSRCQILQRESS